MSDGLSKVQRERKEAWHVAAVMGAIALALVVKFSLTLGERIRVSDAYLAAVDARKCVGSTFEGRAVKLYRCDSPQLGELVSADTMYANARAEVSAAEAKTAGLR